MAVGTLQRPCAGVVADLQRRRRLRDVGGGQRDGLWRGLDLIGPSAVASRVDRSDAHGVFDAVGELRDLVRGAGGCSLSARAVVLVARLPLHLVAGRAGHRCPRHVDLSTAGSEGDACGLAGLVASNVVKVSRAISAEVGPQVDELKAA